MLTNIMRTCPLLLITNVILQRVWTTIKNTVSLFILKTQWNFRKVLKQRRPLTIDCFVGSSEILGKKPPKKDRKTDGQVTWIHGFERRLLPTRSTVFSRFMIIRRCSDYCSSYSLFVKKWKGENWMILTSKMQSNVLLRGVSSRAEIYS